MKIAINVDQTETQKIMLYIKKIKNYGIQFEMFNSDEEMNAADLTRIMHKYDRNSNIVFIGECGVHDFLNLLDIYKYYRRQKQKILLTVGTKRLPIKVSSILYIESQKRKVYFYTVDNTYIVSSTFTNELKKLEKLDFVQSHRSYMVNMNYIVGIERDFIALSNNIIVPLSRSKYSIVCSEYSKYVNKIK